MNIRKSIMVWFLVNTLQIYELFSEIYDKSREIYTFALCFSNQLS